MPKAYWIAQVTVTDPDRYAGYQAVAPAAFQKHGARFLARGGRTETVEGLQWARHVVIEFDSMEQALACYHSDDYTAARERRDGACEAQIFITEGTD
ncbi:DUF1330 domain-containing protein [Falsiruegeria mediterranea]|jgi:uncharacterized protein (DUF1330 family)|uniref:DUF1330 domain-containing protein n=1 Tax=Falsiruegeria mediterranea M17 TaxID=1200281 RepID=A0A2R8CDQ4_9RHOB|nr:DUF1330 domain-containing protein [Falsiruegeria mediterranea]SPJ30567.1 hypothetical protein TRM7615_04101 [Falsiruegeria mediterranea M17]